MRHRVSKNHLQGGRDGSRMIIRKLCHNFIWQGKMTTTQRRAKVVKSQVDSLVSLAKKGTTASRNKLVQFFNHEETVDRIIQISQSFLDRKGGVVKTIRLPSRLSDGALSMRVEWVVMPQIEKVKKEEVLKKNTATEIKKISKKDKKI